MPNIYLAKINLNSNIFDVYNEELSIQYVCKEIFKKLSEKINYKKKCNVSFEDSLGNKKTIEKHEIYNFIELKKNSDDMVITGKLVRSFSKPSETIENSKIIQTFIDESVSILFFYDVNRELIAFCARQSFGYNQFMDAFKNLLNQTVNEYSFELFLKKDKTELNKKLKQLHKVINVKAELIPPNANEDDLAELRQSLMYIKTCQDANATKVKLEYSSDDMNLEASAMKDIYDSVSRGYGDVSTTGYNKNGKKQTINSNQDAPYIINIADKFSFSDFITEAKEFIASLFI